MFGNRLEVDVLQKKDYEKLIAESDEIAAMIVGFSKSLSSKKTKI